MYFFILNSKKSLKKHLKKCDLDQNTSLKQAWKLQKGLLTLLSLRFNAIYIYFWSAA